MGAGAVSGVATWFPYGAKHADIAGEYKFTNQMRDPNGVDHFWMRSYAPQLGRWLTPDPAGLAAVDPSNPQSWNRYAYVLNNPATLVDPFGLDAGDPMCDTSAGTVYCNITVTATGGIIDPIWAPTPTASLIGDIGTGPTTSGGGGGGGGEQQSSPNNTAPTTCVQRALSALPGVTNVTPTENTTPFDAFGHVNETDTLTFNSPAFMTSFLAMSGRRGLVPNTVSEYGFGPGMRFPGGLHSENGAIVNGQLIVTSHIDMFDPNSGLAPLLGHFFVDVLWGHILGRHQAKLDRRCSG